MQNRITQTADGKYIFHSPEPLRLENGKVLPNLTLAFETYGKLNSQKNNVILIHHALSTHSHVKSHALNPQPGWWENMVGENLPIDTQQFFVICINNLGSCYGSSGPLTQNPETSQIYGNTFPNITISDITRSQIRLLDELNIAMLHAVVSPSMGAMISLDLATRYPQRVNQLISISSCYRSYPSNIALRTMQRDIIRLDPRWQQGETQELLGFQLARKLAHLTYRNTQELNHRFLQLEKNPENQRNIHTYLDYNARKFTDSFDVNSYLLLTQAMDDFNIAANANNPTELLKLITAKTLVIGVSSDTLFEPFQQQELYELLQQAGVNCQFHLYESSYGHDAFLVETHGIGKLIRNFITQP
ncbi:MAG: homoserine O-acetyltransferase [Legionellales bacterium]|nr:homoserine O-acetyltransferase [Legionellales bacterium]